MAAAEPTGQPVAGHGVSRALNQRGKKPRLKPSHSGLGQNSADMPCTPHTNWQLVDLGANV